MRLLEGAIISIQALCDRTNPSVYKLNINKADIFAIQFYFLYFFIANNVLRQIFER